MSINVIRSKNTISCIPMHITHTHAYKYKGNSKQYGKKADIWVQHKYLMHKYHDAKTNLHMHADTWQYT